MRGLAFVLFVVAACTDDGGDRVRLYHASPLPPSYSEESVAALEHLGPTVVDHGINFGVYSERATRIEVLLFDDAETARPTRQFPMTRFGDVWNVHVEGIGYGQIYGYVAWGPNWPYVETWSPGQIDGFIADVDAAGNRMNPNKLLMDPYGKAVTRDHDWGRASVATGPARTQSTWGAAAKTVVVQPAYAWSANEATWLARRKDPNAPGNGWNEQIVYEIHPKGFTADPSSGVEHPGTFRGIGEKAAYFEDLGITAVEIMPIAEKPLDGGYWGYHTLDWFVPEYSLGADGNAETRPALILDEVKWMVDQLHQHGVEVWLDVVYNHSGEGGLWREKLQFDDVDQDPVTSSDLANYEPQEVASIYSMRGLDNQAYYCLEQSNQGLYWQATGVGNQMRTNHKPFRQLVMDTLRYWVTEVHVDGFRFDLAPALGAKDLDWERWDSSGDTVLDDIVNEPLFLDNNVRVIAEPWAVRGDYAYSIGKFPATKDLAAHPGVGFYEWNGRFRDWWRAFENNDGWNLSSQEGDADGGFTLTACDRYYQPNGRRPYHSVNFVAIHDGMTMYDLFTYNEKKNGCGPLNPTCCEAALSVWCDIISGEDNNRSRDWGSDEGGEAMKRQLMRNLFVALMIAHGTPMLYGGDEWMRTQLGNNNAYSTKSDNGFNWMQWGSWQASPERQRMHDFVRQLTRFRKAHFGKLAPTEYGGGAPFAWKSETNSEPPNWQSKHLMMHYTDATGGPELAILINGERGDVGFTLPAGSWARLVDTQSWFDSNAFFDQSGAPRDASSNITPDAPGDISASYVVKGSSVVILEKR
ncbi:MAG: alpha-amylase family glycosyl hydrolase [Myxococcota bacterium]